MTPPTFFGYGSLVNLRTHAYPLVGQATVNGWCRVWRKVAGVDHAVLSVTQSEGAKIDGLIAQVPNGDWAALDKRETRYVRHKLPDDSAIYQVMENIVPDSAPILRSYLDVVIQGFHDHFGEDGVARFFQSTTNWQTIADDRAAPLYPRAITVDPQITALVDHHLAVSVK